MTKTTKQGTVQQGRREESVWKRDATSTCACLTLCWSGQAASVMSSTYPMEKQLSVSPLCPLQEDEDMKLFLFDSISISVSVSHKLPHDVYLTWVHLIHSRL